MEFFQFHPTGLHGLGILITEGARGEGGVLVNGRGERFMERYAPTIKDLAPRDMVSRAIMTELHEGRGVDGRDFVLLDLRRIDRRVLDERLPEITSFCKVFMGIDPSETPIPVSPTAHYAMGGIPTDIDGRVLRDEAGMHVEGLYAAGECACVSVHGANRLGCNSLLDTVVFGRRAGAAMRGDGARADRADLGRDALDRVRGELEGQGKRVSGERPSVLRTAFREAMMRWCSVYRSEDGLLKLTRELEELRERAQRASVEDTGTRFNTEALEVRELRETIAVGEAIAHSALVRTESRGAHAREDYPVRDDANWLRHTLVFRDGGGRGVRFAFRPVRITRFLPGERKY
jgi:succinate dehydrogenase / fumarate reductase flavoprotein subunit